MQHREACQTSKTWARRNRGYAYSDDEQKTAPTMQRYSATVGSFHVGLPSRLLLRLCGCFARGICAKGHWPPGRARCGGRTGEFSVRRTQDRARGTVPTGRPCAVAAEGCRHRSTPINMAIGPSLHHQMSETPSDPIQAPSRRHTDGVPTKATPAAGPAGALLEGHVGPSTCCRCG